MGAYPADGFRPTNEGAAVLGRPGSRDVRDRAPPAVVFACLQASIFVVSLTIAPTLANDSMSATLNLIPNSISTATMKLM